MAPSSYATALDAVANSLVVIGIALAVSCEPSVIDFALGMGKATTSDYLLASGISIHLATAVQSWWRTLPAEKSTLA